MKINFGERQLTPYIIQPLPFSNKCLITLLTQEQPAVQGWDYDGYCLEVRNYPLLEQNIINHFNDWVNKGKSIEEGE